MSDSSGKHGTKGPRSGECQVINNAEWILASLRAEKIIPGWNWTSGGGHSTLETAGLEILKGRALENWVSPCLISSPAHEKIEKSIGLLLSGLKWLFFSFQLIFYWILRKVDLHLPPQRRRERNKYRLFRERVWAKGGPGPSPCCPRHFMVLKSPRESWAAWVFAEESTQRVNTARLWPLSRRLFSPALCTHAMSVPSPRAALSVYAQETAAPLWLVC